MCYLVNGKACGHTMPPFALEAETPALHRTLPLAHWSPYSWYFRVLRKLKLGLLYYNLKISDLDDELMPE